MRASSLLLLVLPFLAACYTTEQAATAERSGFLRPYEQLRPGAAGEPLEVFVDEDFDFSRYTKVRIRDIELWLGEDRSDVDEDQAMMLAAQLLASGKQALGQRFELVDNEDDETLIIRAALTEIDASNPTFNFVTTVIPQPFVLSNLARVAFGRHAFVGAASIEAEVLDGATGERVLAAVDRRIGGKTIDGVFDSVADVEHAMTHWATGLNAWLLELRER